MASESSKAIPANRIPRVRSSPCPEAAGHSDPRSPFRALDVVEGSARLRQFADFAGVHVEAARGPGLLARNVGTADPHLVHPEKSLLIRSGVDDG